MNAQSAGPPKRSANIFINYRREDSAGHAGRLFDGLSAHFPGRLFMDVDTIAPGVDFVDAIETAVGACEVLLVVIGHEWLTLKNAAGGRRLDEEGDFVRLELETALARNIRVIPVLVQDTPPPRVEELPPSLARLARRNAIELSDARWAYDVDRLAGTIQGILGEEAAPQVLAETLRPELPRPVAAGRGARPRVLMVLAAALVLASAVMMASTGWISGRGSGAGDLPPAVKPDPGPGNLAANAPNDVLAAPGGAPGGPIPAAAAPPASPGFEISPKTRPNGMPSGPATSPTAPSSTAPSPAVVPNASPLAPVPAVVPSGGQTAPGPPLVPAPDSGQGPDREPPSVTITAPRDGAKVGKTFTAKGTVSGLVGSQRAFLVLKNREDVIYPRGELFEGLWSLETTSSHDDFVLFVVIANRPEAADILSDPGKRQSGLHMLPKGTYIVGPEVSTSREGKISGALKKFGIGKRDS